jgi:hypothetical protein
MGIKFSADGKSIKEIISKILIGLGNNLAYNRLTFLEYRDAISLLNELSSSIEFEFEKEGPKVVDKIYLRKDKEDIYHIYHVINPDFIENVNARVKHVGFVYATSLQKAYEKAQNFSQPWHDTNTRSTSVGDFIKEDGDDHVYIVCGSGFKSIGGIKNLNQIFNEEDLKAECQQNSLESQMGSEY